jgi:D-amino-acid oxidase
MLLYLPWLRRRASESGVRFVDRRIDAFDALFALGAPVVVNCAGLGARELASDPLVRPMHGQVLHVRNDIGLDYSLHDDGPGGLVAYVFAFRDRLVLGGTFEPGREDGSTDRGTIDAIVERCRGLLRMDGHPRWRDLGRTELRALAGARPARGTGEDMRVERVDLGGGRALVHNYGHGRSGVTLSWATAEEAADLALQSSAGTR